MLPSKWADAAVALTAAVGLAIAVGSLAALLVSENETLFGLRSRHYSTAAVLSIIAESAAVLFLTPVLAGNGVRALHRARAPLATAQRRR